MINQFTTFHNHAMKRYKPSKPKYINNKNITCNASSIVLNSMVYWKDHVKNDQQCMSLQKFKCISYTFIETNEKSFNQHLSKNDICHYFDKQKRVAAGSLTDTSSSVNIDNFNPSERPYYTFK